MKSAVKETIPQPFGQISYELSDMLRAISNAAGAVDAFTNRQNYGPAIQQLIYDLGKISEALTLDGRFDLPELQQCLNKFCDGLEGDEFDIDQDAEFVKGTLFLWNHEVSGPDRQRFYRDNFPYDKKLNPDVEEQSPEAL